MRPNRILRVSAVVAGLISSQAFAVTHTWSGGNIFTGNLMTTNANWSGGVPVSGSSNLTLVFLNGVSNANPNQNIANPLSVQSLQFVGSGYSMLGNGYQLDNLGAAPTITFGFNAQSSFAMPVSFTSAGTITQAALSYLGLDQFSGSNMTFNSTATGTGTQLVFGGATSNSVGGNTSFTGGYQVFAQKSANVAALGGNISLQGASPTSLTYLYLVNANQLAPGTNLAALTDSYVSVQSAQTVNNLEATGAGTVINNGANTLTILGSLSNNGGFANIQSGTVDLAGTFKTVNCAVAGGQIDLSSKVINGRIVKIGPGALSMFNASNTFTGQNVVNGGVLAGNPNSLGTSVLNNSIVQLGTGTLTTNLISGPGLVKVSTITFAAAQSYTGGTDVGNTASGDSSTLLGNFTSSTFGELTFNQASNGTFSGNLSGNLKLTKQGTGVLSLNGTNTQTNIVTLANGGLDFQANNSAGSGLLYVGGFGATLQATGTVSLSNTLQFGAVTTFIGSGNLNFTDSTPKTISSGFIHNSTGTTTIAGKFTLASFATLMVNAGNLVLGDPTVVGGFVSNSPIQLNGGTLTVNSFNFTTLADVTLAGGTLNAPNGYAIPLGAALQGSGGVTGRVASANGSTIIATGNLVIGDGSHSAGVNLDGELYTNANTVTLQDSNQSVIGSYTRVGTAANNGTLVASNGLVVNFGRNIEGRGQVQSINALADAVIVNGNASGDSIINYLEFTGYVKGVGTFNNVAFSGTFSPGLSPALLTVGNVVLTPSNVLDIELGGLLRGSQYDAFDVTGTLVLNGQLKLSLINAFTPSLGNQFDIINGTTAGTFTSFNFPTLSPGLFWDTSLLYSQGIVQVVNTPEPTTLSGIVLVCSLLHRRRRTV